jgi:hypothetical protein
MIREEDRPAGDPDTSSAPPPDADDDTDLPGMNPEDEVIPATPGARRRAMLIGLAFLAAILLFLVLFVATNTGRRGGGVLGGAPWRDGQAPAARPLPLAATTAATSLHVGGSVSRHAEPWRHPA